MNKINGKPMDGMIKNVILMKLMKYDVK